MSEKPMDYSKMSEHERCKLAENIFVEYPRLTALVNKMGHCHQYSKIAAEPECMFIGGLAGAGKTTLIDFYLEKFPRTEKENGVNVPVLGARVPNRATDKTLVTALLTKIGDPAAERGSSYNQTLRFQRFVGACEVELIILDEFQHFVDKDSAKILKNVSDWLKNLIDETRVPIILIGMPYADQILDAPGNEQLQRRFAVRESLDSFGWESKEEKAEFRIFLKIVDAQLPLMKRSHLSDPLMAFRFYCATNGRVGKVMKIVRRATELALNQGIETLTLELLAEAYEERLRPDDPERINPFSSDKHELRVIPFNESLPDFRHTNGRSQAKVKVETANNVLRK